MGGNRPRADIRSPNLSGSRPMDNGRSPHVAAAVAAGSNRLPARRQAPPPQHATCGPCYSHARSRPWPTGLSELRRQHAHRRLRHRGRPGGGDSQPHRRARRATTDRARFPPPGATRRLMPYQTGRPWHNRRPSMSSTKKCSGNRLPLSALPADPQPPAPRPRQTTPHPR